MVCERGTLRKLLKDKETIYTIGVGDAFAAKLASEAEGIDAILSSGFSVSAHLMGLPDAELYCRSDNVYAVSNMCYVSKKPIIADIDTGYGNAITIIKTIHEFERAGAQGVIIEDQVSPKRCPICVSDQNSLVSAEEAALKIRAAVENKLYPETVVIARTDATTLEEQMYRSKLYLEAGADLVQPISKAFNCDVNNYARYVKEVNAPVSMIVVGWLDDLTKEELLSAKPKMIHFALLPINTVYPALKANIEYVGKNLTQVGMPYERANHNELVNFLGMPDINKLEDKYIPKT